MPALDVSLSPSSSESFITPQNSLAQQPAAKDSISLTKARGRLELSSFEEERSKFGKAAQIGKSSVNMHGIGGGGSNAATDKQKAMAMLPQFDPRALLNPKAATKRAQESESEAQGERKAMKVGMGAMLERMHNVENRQRNPQKKRKLKTPDQEGEKAGEAEQQQQKEPEVKQRSTFEGGGSSTVLGEYVKQKQAQGDRERMDQGSSIVDLTADDDDDGEPDIVLVKDTGEREVCLGKVDTASVMAFQVPSPKSTGFKGTDKHWPIMKVSLNRRFPTGNNIVVSVRDPSGNEFGRLDPKIAAALVPLMDAVATNRIRVVARLEMRKKETNEKPMKPISKDLPLNITLFAPKKLAQSIGKYLGQRQIYLRNPTFPEKIELFNPHAPPVPTLPIRTPNAIYSSGAGGGTGYITRTVEEIRNDVMCMFDALTKTEDLAEKDQNSRIMTPLLKHQKQALHFLLRKETDLELREDESDIHCLWRIRTARNGKRTYYNIITGHEYLRKPPPILGGILADMMGLGKTLSVLSLIVHTLNEAQVHARKLPTGLAGDEKLICNSKGTLLICPVSTVANWEEQIKAHIEPGTLRYYIYHGSNRTQDVHELSKYDVVLTTYSIVASEFDRSGRRPIQQINWFRIVLDEAHMIRGQSTKQSQAVCALEAERRWAVTGTPVQNRLDDLGALIKFLRIKPFDEKNGFTQFILSPFKNADPEILPKLRLLVDSITLRRLKDKIDIPPRNDQLIRLDFSDEERLLYDLFAKDSAQKVRAVTSDRKSLGGKACVHILQAILRLRLICAHGQELLSDEDMKLTEGLSYSNAIDLGDEDDDRPALSPKQAYDMFHLLKESDMDRCSICNCKVGLQDGDVGNEVNGSMRGSITNGSSKDENVFGHMTPCYQILCTSCVDQFKAQVAERATLDNRVVCPLCEQYVRVSFFELRQDELEEDEETRQRIKENPKLAKQMGKYNGPHTKTRALVESLKESEQWSIAHANEEPLKSVIFSGWTAHLDLIQLALEDARLSFTRLDGSMSRTQRTSALNIFRTDPQTRIMLISIGAGGLGLNLTAASRAYVMEPQFNPAAEAQAVDRVHRLGQTRSVTITRFIMRDSFEEKMLELQQKKRNLADLSMNRNTKLDKAEAAKRRLEELRSLFR